MDHIFIEDLEVNAIIGVLAHERKKKQPVIINLEISVNNLQAASNDNLIDAVDYSAIATRLTEFAENSEFQLIETLAEKMAELILKEFNVKRVRLRLAKPKAITNAKAVGVVIERKSS